MLTARTDFEKAEILGNFFASVLTEKVNLQKLPPHLVSFLLGTLLSANKLY